MKAEPVSISDSQRVRKDCGVHQHSSMRRGNIFSGENGPGFKLTTYLILTHTHTHTHTQIPVLSVTNIASYLGGPWFNSRPQDRMLGLHICFVIVSLPQSTLGYDLQSSHGRFHPHPF